MSQTSAEELFEKVLGDWSKAGIAQEHIERIKPLIKFNHYIHLVPDRNGESWSRWGGEPLLVGSPPSDGRFLCQIDLSEIPDSPAKESLPAEGFLYFFVHKRGRDKCDILYRKDAPAKDSHGSSIRFEARTELIFPEYESDEFDELDFPEEVGNIYMDWEEDYMGNSFTRFTEGCRLLGGWTDEALGIQRTLRSDERDKFDIFLSLDPHENAAVKSSGIGRIPLLSQRLYILLSFDAIKQNDFSRPMSRYGKSS